MDLPKGKMEDPLTPSEAKCIIKILKRIEKDEISMLGSRYTISDLEKIAEAPEKLIKQKQESHPMI